MSKITEQFEQMISAYDFVEAIITSKKGETTYCELMQAAWDLAKNEDYATIESLKSRVVELEFGINRLVDLQERSALRYKACFEEENKDVITVESFNKILYEVFEPSEEHGIDLNTAIALSVDKESILVCMAKAANYQKEKQDAKDKLILNLLTEVVAHDDTTMEVVALIGSRLREMGLKLSSAY
jgi:hypothetical protein